ncbi:MAG: selenium cofactor biosynthesis protein YqeC [Rubrobacteraceae bacterium]
MELREALNVSAGDTVAVAGAGGKSGAILALAAELNRAGLSTLVAPTTKMFLKEVDQLGPLVVSEDASELRRLTKKALAGSSSVTAGKGLISRKRIEGVEPEWVGLLSPLADVTLVEADGSRRRPLKGTAPYEPVLPKDCTLVVAVGNVEALGKPLNGEYVHRPEILSGLTGLGADQSITARAFAVALAHGTLGKIPTASRRSILISGVKPGKSMAGAAGISRELWRLGLNEVVMSSLPEEIPPQVWLP